ncbi:hypothetical protein QYM36_011761 [Artemia franciscana]|uniref:Uncharacterized protein n=1 Tax=Artemia franciscana TaxID=6661 RepID=A0AA88KZA4_ARTSF|nr:hypothetical protein QYM36_011761 [Artemia franciscana]
MSRDRRYPKKDLIRVDLKVNENMGTFVFSLQSGKLAGVSLPTVHGVEATTSQTSLQGENVSTSADPQPHAKDLGPSVPSLQGGNEQMENPVASKII